MQRRANGEGSAFAAHGNGFSTKLWVEDPVRGRRRVTLVAPTRAELTRKVREAKTASEAGQTATPSRQTFRVFAETWKETTLPARDVSPATRRLYKLTLDNHVIPVLGDVELGRIRPSHVDEVLLAAKRKGLGASSRRLAYNVTRMVLDTAVRDAAIRVNPAVAVERPVNRASKQANHSAAASRAVIAACVGERTLEQVVPLMMWTAMRVGECLALRWDDVDLGGRVLWVRATMTVDEDGRVYRALWPKDKEPRPVPLIPAAVEALRSARAAQAGDRVAAGEAWADDDLVFADELGGLVDDRALRNPFRRVMSSVGLRGSFHAMRRSCATLMMEAGVPLPIISAILGHSSVSVTATHYTYVDTDAMRAALEAMAATA